MDSAPWLKVDDLVNTLAPDEAFVDVIRYEDVITNKSKYYGFAVSRLKLSKGPSTGRC